MAHACAHNTPHHHASSARQNILVAFWLNFVFCLIELVGGIWIGSVAILADAVHDLGDTMSLGAAWYFEKLATRGRDRKFNFGYRRFSLLSALISAVVISVGSVLIIIEAIERLRGPETSPLGWPMVGLAVLGVAVNGFAAFRMSQGKTQNEKVMTWHLLEDVLGWVLVLLGGIAIVITGAGWLDATLALGLAAFVLFNVFRHLRKTVFLFLQGQPDQFAEDQFSKEVTKIPGVARLENVGVWSSDGEEWFLTCEVHLKAPNEWQRCETIKSEIRKIAERFCVTHTTIEVTASHD